MRAPSNRSGIPAVPVALLLGVILFVGLALAPRAFEFDAWPELSRQNAVEEIVARPAEQVIEVPVARVDARKRSRGSDALAVRGRNVRKGAPAREARDARGEARTPRGGRGRTAPSVPPVVVEDPPAEAPEAAELPPEQPAQLAEGPTAGVLRPEAEALPVEERPAPLRDLLRDTRGHGDGGPSSPGVEPGDCSD
jgi:hypothetical protein